MTVPAIVDLAELEARMAQFNQRIISAQSKAWHAEARPMAERELCDWFAERGVALVGLTDG